MKKILLAILLFSASFSYGQTVGQFRYDTTKFLKVGGYNEVKIENATKGVTGGVFTNVGNGWGKWLKLDSLITGTTDTTVFSITLDSTGQPQSRVLFGGANNHITSDASFLYSSTLKKLLIGGTNISVGGPTTKFYVFGGAGVTGNLSVGGSVIANGIPSGVGTKALRYNPITGVFSYADTTTGGGSGNTNSNIGSGYRWAVPNTNNIKTYVPGYGLIADSTTNANAITVRVDSATLSQHYVTNNQIQSLNVGGDYLKVLNDSSIYFDSSKVLVKANNLLDLASVPTARTNLGLTDANIRALFSATGSGGSYDNTTGVFTLSGGSGWGLTGNAGTTAGTNFLGTTDNINLMFKRNSIQAGLVDSNAAQTGITLFGVSAGRLNTALASTGFGFQALFSNTTGASNTAMGNQALKFNTTGTRNTAFGFGALKTLAADNDNTAMGYNTLTLATGGQNTAFGLAAQGITTGTGNTAMGYSTLRTNTAGLNNVAIGIGAMDANTGSANIGIGYYALGANGAGSNNIAIGYNAALGVNTSGIQNIAIGQNSLGANTTASNSSAFGHRAGEQSTGAANTFIGAFAGRYITSETGVFVVNSLDRSTKALDQYASLIYGQNSTTDQKLSFNARVGLNTLAPTAWLHLTQGSAAAGFAPLKFDAPTAVLATTAASGTGAVATLTFAAESTIPYALGSTITVAGVTPAGYNATATVIASTTTSVSYLNTTTGVQTVAGTITQGPLLTTPENGAVEYDGADFYGTTGGVRYKLTKTLTGTAAPATTPATVGVMFVDTVNAKIYVSTGTASSADWSILN